MYHAKVVRDGNFELTIILFRQRKSTALISLVCEGAVDLHFSYTHTQKQIFHADQFNATLKIYILTLTSTCVGWTSE